jgi:hypothetical protein
LLDGLFNPNGSLIGELVLVRTVPGHPEISGAPGQKSAIRNLKNSPVVIVHDGDAGPVEAGRHKLTRPGTPAIIEAHFPPATAGAPGAGHPPVQQG